MTLQNKHDDSMWGTPFPTANHTPMRLALALDDGARYLPSVIFQLTSPSSRAAPLIVEVPHAGTDIPADVADTLTVDMREVRRDGDLFVDELFRSAPAHGATLLTAQVSRYVIDLNRAPEDVDH